MGQCAAMRPGAGSCTWVAFSGGLVGEYRPARRAEVECGVLARPQAHPGEGRVDASAQPRPLPRARTYARGDNAARSATIHVCLVFRAAPHGFGTASPASARSRTAQSSASTTPISRRRTARGREAGDAEAPHKPKRSAPPLVIVDEPAPGELEVRNGGTADPASVRPRLAAAAAESVDDIRRRCSTPPPRDEGSLGDVRVRRLRQAQAGQLPSPTSVPASLRSSSCFARVSAGRRRPRKRRHRVSRPPPPRSRGWAGRSCRSSPRRCTPRRSPPSTAGDGLELLRGAAAAISAATTAKAPSGTRGHPGLKSPVARTRLRRRRTGLAEVAVVETCPACGSWRWPTTSCK